MVVISYITFKLNIVEFNKEREEIYSERVKAGKRTYFFDIKQTRNGDYYLTITESKKEFQEEGKFNYKKSKVFLYKEDLNKFIGAFNRISTHIKEELLPNYDFAEFDRKLEEERANIEA